ncbi:indole-3-glycerol-phosphate synthase [Pelotomaculum isophthalicicum JI]|uniref:indole-3-glycerol-phosphate synthase n=1 Tax=Pelotomaculum isophthalicicum JI TaxID=947010 RepID=A0A9X4JWM5_9FIRM|nr:indole-3-glycerol-phosphate synthase [Pelotomaculum isophthalicicum]MDF9409463.1 indole-3-glycerol-phosphate synthase [Pelotomaculum isophthalicicum JI]
MNTRFSDALLARKKAGFLPVIPDIKCASPKEGDLLRGRDPVEAAKLLAKAGAPALSVVTEPKNFGGSLELLERIAAETKLPILRKDFITSVEDLKLTKTCGAEAVLLICAIQPFPLLMELYGEALKIGLEPLVEAHTKEELIMAGKTGAKLVGINNRNILELEKDDGTVYATALLAAYKPKDAILISESSIQTPAQAQAAVRAGADAVLIGTAIWQAENMRERYLALSEGL